MNVVRKQALYDPKSGDHKTFKVRSIKEKVLAAKRARDEQRKKLKQEIYGKQTEPPSPPTKT